MGPFGTIILNTSTICLCLVLAFGTTATTSASTTGLASRSTLLHYEIDTLATKTTYETKYLTFIPVRGVFERMSGTLIYDAQKPASERQASIHVIIDATTLTPHNFDSEAKRRMLRGSEFFYVEKYSTIEFKSSKFRYTAGVDEKLIAIDGTVTLRGISKPVTLRVLKSQCNPATEATLARCTASTEWILKRFEFGMNGWARTVSDEVKIAVELVAYARQGVDKSTAKNGANNDGKIHTNAASAPEKSTGDKK